jgi:hypothetical protein
LNAEEDENNSCIEIGLPGMTKGQKKLMMMILF